MHVLLVEPDYYTRYPPLGLLKLGALHRDRGDTVELVRSPNHPSQRPDLIYVTSLFTYAWRPVHEAVRQYKSMFPNARVHLGGIYASLLPEHAALSGAEVHLGLHAEAEALMPAYDLVPEWDSTILFASRGCIRRCGFCSVPKLEGRPSDFRYGIKNLIYDGHTSVIFWDNNILGNPNWKSVFDEMAELKIEVDFNQGLDGRLLTEEVADKVARCKMKTIRLAYDYIGVGPYIEKAIRRLRELGVSPKKIVVYTLFNYIDDPENFFHRVRDLLNWGAVCYPMRFEPLTSLDKNKYVSPKWDAERLSQVARARRVMGYAGAFPPYKGLLEKLNRAEDFDDAFSLRPIVKEKSVTPVRAVSEMSQEILTPVTYHGSGRLRKVKDWRQMLR
jgi:pyruvate-formate lyase-activating enzyme